MLLGSQSGRAEPGIFLGYTVPYFRYDSGLRAGCAFTVLRLDVGKYFVATSISLAL
jgi:hypothetical protein